MGVYSNRLEKNNLRSCLAILAAVAVNFLMSFFTGKLGFPIYLDTIGTMGIAIIGGLFPAIVTAVATNIVCVFFNSESIYFSFINVFIAVVAVRFYYRGISKKKINPVIPGLVMGIGSGLLAALVQWGILGGIQNQSVSDVVDTITVLPKFVTFLILNIILNIFDKGLSLGLALLITSFVPDIVRIRLRNFGWKQNMLSEEEINAVRSRSRDTKHSIRIRNSLTMVGVSMALVIIMAGICMNIYFENVKEERTKTAVNTAAFAAEVINPDKIGNYLRNGIQEPGYADTEHMLYNIRKNATGVKYLYALTVEEDGCYFIFDLDTDDEKGNKPGTKTEIDESFRPYLQALLKGEEIEPIESNDAYGWLLTAYSPVRDKTGRTVCYVGADVSMDYMAENMNLFAGKILIVMAGLFILVMAFGLWMTNVYTVYPIGSITSCVDKFAAAGDSQEELDENVKRIRALNIQTGDEVEKLYQAICKMSLEQAEQMRQIRHYSETTAKMQDGLIITMADMVENRDSDTGAHVQKTAAYVRIIVEGLRKKGYYLEKITDKYVADVVRSAPLHDVGKINIPDGVLNKPGKLTDEEYEIMKTHTTAGKKIMEKAISTVHGENYLKEARNMAAYHHERWDGKGYPEGLHGEVIPLSARIMAVADVFDALSSPRVYKPAFSLEKALNILTEGKGTQFDPKCIEVFMEALPEVKVILKKYNSQE